MEYIESSSLSFLLEEGAVNRYTFIDSKFFLIKKIKRGVDLLLKELSRETPLPAIKKLVEKEVGKLDDPSEESVKIIVARKRAVELSSNLKREIEALEGKEVPNPSEVDSSINKVLEACSSALSSYGNSLNMNVNEFKKSLQEIKERVVHFKKNGKVKGEKVIATGMKALDRLLGGGMRCGDLFVVGARPSVGKTSLLTNVACTALDNGQNVMIISMEVPAHKISEKIIGLKCGIRRESIRTGRLSDMEKERLDKIEGKINEYKCSIIDSCGESIDSIKALIYQINSMNNVDLICVDYVQLLKSPRSENRNLEISEISRTFKRIAIELQCPIMLLSQLSRKVEDRVDGGKAKLSDLRESGSLEQDADMVLLLSNKGQEVINATLGKNRDGPIGDFLISFTKETGKMQTTGDNK